MNVYYDVIRGIYTNYSIHEIIFRIYKHLGYFFRCKLCSSHLVDKTEDGNERRFEKQIKYGTRTKVDVSRKMECTNI